MMINDLEFLIPFETKIFSTGKITQEMIDY